MNKINNSYEIHNWEVASLLTLSRVNFEKDGLVHVCIWKRSLPICRNIKSWASKSMQPGQTALADLALYCLLGSSSQRVNFFTVRFHKVDSSMLKIGPLHFLSNRKFVNIKCLSGKQKLSWLNLHCLKKAYNCLRQRNSYYKWMTVWDNKLWPLD